MKNMIKYFLTDKKDETAKNETYLHYFNTTCNIYFSEAEMNKRILPPNKKIGFDTNKKIYKKKTEKSDEKRKPKKSEETTEKHIGFI